MALRLRGLKARGLDPVDLDVGDGECVAVMGPSGSGKSLLLRAIADLDPSEGTAEINGRDRAAMPAPDWRRQVGYLAAVPGWWADHVGDHFADKDAARPLIEALGLKDDAFGWPVSRLSTGEGQRLALARLLSGKPPVLLLDEPTGAVDETARKSVEAIIKDRLADGAAIIVVTHDPDQADRLATRMLTIDNGTAREDAP